MASNHYPVDYEIEVKVKVKVKQLHNYHSMSEDQKAEAVGILQAEVPEIVVHSLNSNRHFVNYDNLLGYKGAADSYELEANI
jgi:hypothetical protein